MAFRFNSTGDKLTTTETVAIGTEAFSASCWYYHNGNPPNSYGKVISIQYASSDATIHMYLNNSTLYGGFSPGSGWYETTLGTLTAGNWYYLAFSASASTTPNLGFYAASDGSSTWDVGDEPTAWTNSAAANLAYFIENGNNSGEERINGYLCNFKGWKTELTGAQLLAEKDYWEVQTTTGIWAHLDGEDNTNLFVDNESVTWTDSGTVTFISSEPTDIQHEGGGTTPAALAEAVTPTSVFVGFGTYPAAISEPVTAASAKVGLGRYGAGVVSAATAGDSSGKRADLLGASSDPVTPQAVLDALQQFDGVIADSVTSSDAFAALLAGGAGYAAAAAAGDAWILRVDALASLLEAAGASESITAEADYLGALVESATALDQAAVGLTAQGLISEPAVATASFVSSNWAYVRVQYTEPSPPQNDLDRTEITLEVVELTGDDRTHVIPATSSSGGGAIDVTLQVPLGQLTSGTVNVSVYAYDTSDNQSTVSTDQIVVSLAMAMVTEPATAADAYYGAIAAISALTESTTVSDVFSASGAGVGNLSELATAGVSYGANLAKLGAFVEGVTPNSLFATGVAISGSVFETVSPLSVFASGASRLAAVSDSATAADAVIALAMAAASIAESATAGSAYLGITADSAFLSEDAAAAFVASALSRRRAILSENAVSLAAFSAAAEILESVAEAVSLVALFAAAGAYAGQVSEGASAQAVFDYRGGVGFLVASISIVNALSARDEISIIGALSAGVEINETD